MRENLACDYSNLSKKFIRVQKYITNSESEKKKLISPSIHFKTIQKHFFKWKMLLMGNKYLVRRNQINDIFVSKNTYRNQRISDFKLKKINTEKYKNCYVMERNSTKCTVALKVYL